MSNTHQYHMARGALTKVLERLPQCGPVRLLRAVITVNLVEVNRDRPGLIKCGEGKVRREQVPRPGTSARGARFSREGAKSVGGQISTGRRPNKQGGNRTSPPRPRPPAKGPQQGEEEGEGECMSREALLMEAEADLTEAAITTHLMPHLNPRAHSVLALGMVSRGGAARGRGVDPVHARCCAQGARRRGGLATTCRPTRVLILVTLI